MKNLLVEQLTAVAEVKQAASYQQKQKACILTGLGGSSKPVFCVAIDKILGEKGSLAFVVASREEIRAYRRELNYFYPDLPMQELYPVNLPRVQADTQSLEVQAGRAAALRFLQGEERGIVFITAEALQQKQFVPRSFNKNLVINLGEEREQQEVIATLVALGYERTAQVDAIGQFCLRGDILDVFPINSNVAVRIEWFDNEIDAVRSFDINNQRSIQSLDEIKIAPLV
ncbi:MAG: transcription-repair coupling factor, partial [Phascolarctobacterium sp.]|nr:transcription-repair coupling factor [Phascolarctobacterium sp.]